MKPVFIYDFWSITDYLNAWCDHEKSVNRQFSYQYFANKAGFKSKSSIANILAGRKKVSIDSLIGLSNALKLNIKQTHYLEALIHYECAKEDGQKQYYRDRLLYLKPAQPAYNLERAYIQFLEEWYVSHVRELVTLVRFDENYKKLGLMLSPPISAKDAKRAVDLLLELNFIQQYTDDDTVYYTQTNAVITTPHYLPKSLSIRNYQKKIIELGASAIDRIKKDERNINNATLTLCEEGVVSMNNLIAEFQQKMVKIALESEGKSSRVYQANIQFFPTSLKQ